MFSTLTETWAPTGKRPKRWKNGRDTGVYTSPHFSIATRTPSILLPKGTTRWIRNATDERAAQEGARFSEDRGQFTVEWIETFCHLYEGDKAGSTIVLDDWQYEACMQIFGWTQFSQHYGKYIRRFTSGSVWVPKKNKKSPTAAAIGIYMLIGDGEPGQKCFSAAHDGVQAQIAHKHAVAMIDFSENLSENCIVNRQTQAIHYVPTNSFYTVVTGKNVKSTQGFNGSIFIDEVHVVDEKLYDSLQYAGISRAEPLLLTFSTAGDDLGSLGYILYQKSLDITKGTLYIPNCYAAIFGDFSTEIVTEKKTDGSILSRKLASEDWYKEEIAIPLIRKANPALGDTVKEEEIISSWRAAQRSQTEMSRFLKYRVNQWTSGDMGWINPSDWAKCGRNFTIEEMFQQGIPCALAADLSRTGDMTSLTATFSVKERIRAVDENGLPSLSPENTPIFVDFYRPQQITWTWIPEATADQRLREHGINFRQWEDSHSNLTICKKSRTVPYALVASRIAWLWKNFDCRGLGYDSWNSEQLVNLLVEEHNIDPDLLFKIPQYMSVMGPLASQFEKDVLDGTLVHTNAPILLWQISNVQLHEDANGNYKPKKPERNSPRSIDAIISSVMSEGMFYLPEMGLTNKPTGSISMLTPGDKYVSQT